MKYAVVFGTGERFAHEVEALLPELYEIIPSTLTTTPDNRKRVGIQGDEFLGWTLEGYVIPRLQSGNFAVEVCRSLEQVRERTQGVMN